MTTGIACRRDVDTGAMARSQSKEKLNIRWSPTQRVVASLLLATHLLAVFASPWSSPPPAPLLAQRISGLFRGYQTAAFLNHGYRFFAPDPGPSHVIRYVLTRPDGQEITGRLPDPNAHWPRIIYHRHFMISETLFNLHRQIEDPPEFLPPSEKLAWQQRNHATQQLVDRLAEAVGRELLVSRRAQKVHLFLEEHSIPYPEDVMQGLPLDAPDLYNDLADLGEYSEVGR